MLRLKNKSVQESIRAIEKEYNVRTVDILNKTRDHTLTTPTAVRENTVPDPIVLFDHAEFRQEYLLGEGGYASVYKGILRGSEVALKVQDKDLFESALVEIAVMRTLSHQNIETIQGFSFDSSINTYFTMYVRRETLRDAIEMDRPIFAALKERENIWVNGNVTGLDLIDINVRRYIAFQLISGLAYMHSLGVIHNDIKPDNILMVSDHDIKITDFGRCIPYEPSDNYKNEPCTITYRPIEHLNNAYAFKYFFEVDVWATGITLLEMETGCHPMNMFLYEHLSDEELVTVVRDILVRLFGADGKKELTFVEDKNFASMCKAMLNFNPCARITSEDLLRSLSH
jgi:serine/threonine protein kinase